MSTITRTVRRRASAMYLMLGVAAMVYSSSARAEQIAFLENEAGGRIYITDVESKDGACPGAYVAYATSPSGAMLFGCWLIDGETILVRWPDGEVSGYETRQFRQLVRQQQAPI